MVRKAASAVADVARTTHRFRSSAAHLGTPRSPGSFFDACSSRLSMRASTGLQPEPFSAPSIRSAGVIAHLRSPRFRTPPTDGFRPPARCPECGSAPFRSRCAPSVNATMMLGRGDQRMPMPSLSVDHDPLAAMDNLDDLPRLAHPYPVPGESPQR